MNSYFFSPIPGRANPVAVHGEGIYIYDDLGNQYIDGCSGAMTVNLGHGNKEIETCIKEQLDKLTFTYRSQFTNKPLEELCQKIAHMAPDNLEMVSLANSGSEAAELAMKLACTYWNANGKPEKRRIISRWSSYHGSTIGALSMTGNASRRREYSSYLSDFPILELPLCHRCPYEKEYSSCNLFCANYLQKVIDRFGADTVSAVICEPITGASGAGITPPDDYFPTISKICKKNNILLIMDEVITGFGRTGRNFASNHWNINPDIIVFGKGVSSGFGPLSGIIADKEIYNSLAKNNGEFSTGHTYSGNPLSAAAAGGVLDYIKEHGIINEVAKKSIYFKNKLIDLMNGCSMIDDIRGKGLLWGVELAKDKKSKECFDPKEKMTARLVDICFMNGLIVYPSAGFINGLQGDSIMLSPPLIITEKEIDYLFELLEKSIINLEKQVF